MASNSKTDKFLEGIGGFPDLRNNQPARDWAGSSIMLNSARNALRLLLQTLQPQALWLPRYICDSVISAAKRESITIRFYSIGSSLLPTAPDETGDSELILYPNYFGVAAEAERAVVNRFGRERVLLDRSQALFSNESAALAEIYSPRKFLGMPDGGLLRSDVEVTRPTMRHTATAEAISHLSGRIESGSQYWLDHFRKAEEVLGDSEPARISRTAEYLLSSADLNWASRTRTENFTLLHKALGPLNRLGRLLDESPTGPLCYPLLPAHDSQVTQVALAGAGVYCARYWPEVTQRPGTSAFEREMAERCLALPCDQRYSAREMKHIIETVQSLSK